MWKIEKIVSKGDYNYALVKGHPNATRNGYVLEHRIVVENHLMRLLDPNEVVHHLNENKKDNRIENLEVMSANQHAVLHAQGKETKLVELRCPSCHALFIRHRIQTHLVKKNNSYCCCSRSCSGRFSRMIQLNGRTQAVELAISENIVREFCSLDNPEQTEKQRDA